MRLKRSHQLSGIIISIFVVLHLFNHVSSIYGAKKHIEIMTMLRVVYRNVVAEIILISAVLFQIISGIKLFRASRKIARSGFEKLQRWSGLYLAIFFILHLTAVLGGRFLLKLDTNFYFGVAGLNTFPFNLYFIPYYGLAILSFFGHIASVHHKKITQNIFGLTPNTQSVVILIFGLCITFIIFYGLTNQFSGVAIPKENEILIGK